MSRKRNPKGMGNVIWWVAGGAAVATVGYFVWKANQPQAPQSGIVVTPQGATVTTNKAQAIQACLEGQKAGVIPPGFDCQTLASGTG